MRANLTDPEAGWRLFILRWEAGLSQRELAARANCSRATIARCENGGVPVPRHAAAIAHALGVLVSEIWDLQQNLGHPDPGAPKKAVEGRLAGPR